MSTLEKLEKALAEWMGECIFPARRMMPDGVTPYMGKFEAEELYRVGSAYLAARKSERDKAAIKTSPANEKILVERLERVGPVEVRHRIYDESLPASFEWINRPAIIRGVNYSYLAVVLCSFPETSGKVRYIVEDSGRLFIQRKEQITYADVDDQGRIYEQIKEVCDQCGGTRSVMTPDIGKVPCSNCRVD